MKDMVHRLMATHPELAALHGWPVIPERPLDPPEPENGWRDPGDDDFTYEDDEEE